MKVNPVNHRFIILFAALVTVSSSLPAQDPQAAGVQFFETKIRPLLLNHCADCHGADTQEANLRLDTPGQINAGGKSGAVIVPGKIDQSLLISAVRFKDEALQMPPDDKMPDEAIATLVKWVEMGAPMPVGEAVAAKANLPFDLKEARQHWSFKEVHAPPLPEQTSTSSQHPIDLFIFANLEKQGLTPSPQASKRALIRRAYIDLIGLPPTPEQVAAFLADERPDAFDKVVEQLLDSPRYGERWARHWLDIVRYADSNGLDENVAHGNAWRYRDYVIEAFNSDKPFDQFMKEQLAGDLLDGPAGSAQERLIATGFLTLGPKVLAEGDEAKLQMDIIDEQIDTTGRVFLGLTLGCARCHDHKFDPIRADDYYALAGIFKSTKTMESLKRIAKWNEHIIATPEELEAKRLHDEQIAMVTAEIDKLTKQQTENKTVSVDATGEKVEEVEPSPSISDQLATLNKQLKDLKANVPELSSAMGVAEGEPVDVPIHVRGSHLSLGREVQRGLPIVLVQDDPTLQHPEQSGRLELANWLGSETNPLTSRVLVNRIWRWHFGSGIVPTIDNFGLLGSKPTHPELLDWLAAEFMKNGWSIKELHRLIMSSQTYQMSSAPIAANVAVDPENTHFWRANRQRLEAEIFRDSLLAVSGQLDTTMGGSMLHVKNREFIFNHTSKDETNYDTTRRSIYLPVIRNNLYVGFSLFDYTDASVPNGDRATSTVAPQALYALNSDLVLTAAEKLAERLLEESPQSKESSLQRLFELTFGRLPTDSEIATISKYLSESKDSFQLNDQQAWTSLCQTFLISNEFIYVE